MKPGPVGLVPALGDAVSQQCMPRTMSLAALHHACQVGFGCTGTVQSGNCGWHRLMKPLGDSIMQFSTCINTAGRKEKWELIQRKNGAESLRPTEADSVLCF